MRGSIRFAEDEIDQIPILRCIYELESIKISGGVSYQRKLDDCLWESSEIASFLKKNGISTEKAQALIDRLVAERQMMAIPAEQGHPARYISRVGETIRLLGHCYEYWYRGWPTIAAVRWTIEDKKVPRRSIKPQEFIEELQNMVRDEIGDGPETENLLKAIEMVVTAVSKKVVKSAKDWSRARFSRFQVDSAKEMIRAQYCPAGRLPRIKRTQILTAGVGAGKTFAFTIPMLVSAVEGILGGYDSQRVHLFLYPRTALAKDQADEVQRIAKYIGLEDLRVHFEHTMYLSQKYGSVRQGIEEVYRPDAKPPQIIITTLETLKRRLHHPRFVCALARTGLARVVLDEIHLVEGLTGNQVIRLMARLEAACKVNKESPLLWTASSATVATPAEHAHKIFGVPVDDVQVIEPNPQDMATVGLAHHVFLRIGHGVSHIGALVNSTSIAIHNRRHTLTDRKEEECRTICFADTLDALGRWNADLRENERTEHGYGWNRRQHPEANGPQGWEDMEREVPYALRYINPLQRRMEAQPGTNEPFSPVLKKATEREPCSLCRQGERKKIAVCTPEEMKELAVVVYRYPTDDADNVKRFQIRNPIFETRGKTVVGTMDLCPYLQSASCHWFPEADFQVQQIPQSKYYEWANVARSRIHSSKTAFLIDEAEGDLQSVVFKGTIQEIYDVWPRANNESNEIECDVVLASPSLEVGIDISNLTESLMYKAIRNVASYRQKAGRVGREIGSDSLNITLLSDSPIDLHYYRQPAKLTSAGHLDPIPLKEHNQLVLASSFYSGVWDFLATKGVLPEAFPWRDCGTEFKTLLRACVRVLGEKRNELVSYLLRIGRETVTMDRAGSRDLVNGAIEQVLVELEFLLSPIKGLFIDQRIETASDIIIAPLCGRGIPELIPEALEARTHIETYTQRFETHRKQIEPVNIGLAEEIHRIDQMVKSGWDLDALAECIQGIETRVEELKSSTHGDADTDTLSELTGAVETLKRIASKLQAIKTRGYDPKVLYLVSQFSKFQTESRMKRYYLSFILSELPVFRVLKRKSYYVRPDNLFTNPYEHQVDVVKHGHRGQSEEDTVQLSEALFGFLPGTWTFRLGKTPYKTRVGTLVSRNGDKLDATIDEMSRAGQRFVPLPGTYPIPLDKHGRRLDLFRPTEIHLNQCDKYVMIRPGFLTIVDEDEEQKGGSPKPIPIKIPRSFPNKWYHLIPSPGNPVQLTKLGTESLAVTDESGNPLSSGDASRQLVKHPLFGNLLDGVQWHEILDVTEYVYQISRTYDTKAVNGATLQYRTKGGSGPAGLGRQVRTEGVSVRLHAPTVDRLVLDIRSRILDGSPAWIPSALKALEALVITSGTEEGSAISNYVVRDFMTCIVSILLPMIEPSESRPLVDLVSRTLEDVDNLRTIARNYLRFGKAPDDLDGDVEQLEMSRSTTPDDVIEARVQQIVDLVPAAQEAISKIPDFIDKWIRITLLNTFGAVALESLREFAGVHSFDVGYTIDLEGIESNEYRIFLYDNSPSGNGSTRVLYDYMHIIQLQRTMDSQSRYLPTDDYLTVLERNLLQCPQFHQDVNALEMLRQETNGERPEGYPEMAYVRIHSDEILSISRNTWNELGIKGPSDAWKLPLFRRISSLLPQVNPNLCEDDVLRATGICWNGCPECVDSSGGIMAALAGTSFSDKALLDYWVEQGLSQTPEYSYAPLSAIASGEVLRGIGAPSRVTMKQEGQVLRAISMPYTVGFNIERDQGISTSEHIAKMLVRTNDIAGMEAIGPSDNEEYPLPSSGFGRLVWFTLIMSSYLDRVGLLAGEPKEIDLVFYAATQIPVDTTGLSPTVISTLDYYRRKSGAYGQMENLSHVLNWLAECDFKVRLCIDEETLSNPTTLELLRDLDIDPRLEVYVSDLKARMHQKILITPIGGVSGSSNLTLGGTSMNIESVSYKRPGTKSFRAWKLRSNDTIASSRRLDLARF